jgi:hypothetical protein
MTMLPRKLSARGGDEAKTPPICTSDRYSTKTQHDRVQVAGYEAEAKSITSYQLGMISTGARGPYSNHFLSPDWMLVPGLDR